MRKNISLIAGTLLVLCMAGRFMGAPPERPVYLDSRQSLEIRVSDLLQKLTLEEKIGLCHGDSFFTNAGIPRLGIKKLVMSDGPHGVREELAGRSWKSVPLDDAVTALPTGIALAATWNPVLAKAYGELLGAEARAHGKDVILGPAVNLCRTPLGGRNFEYLGEDPYLTARLVVGYINGVQSQGVGACVKHFAANNQEANRLTTDEKIDERTLRELYFPAFQAAVSEAGVSSVMSAYNKINGTYCSENAFLLNKVLKGEWNFKGVVISDWGATHTTIGSAINGLDLEMNGTAHSDDYYFGQPLYRAVRAGQVPGDVLDDKVRRILRLMISVGVLDETRPAGSVNTPAHQGIARQIAEESIVLLKNRNGLLPIDLSRVKKLAVIGANATEKLAGGGGSSRVKAQYEVTPLEGLQRKIGALATIAYARGYSPNPAEDASSLRTEAVELAKHSDLIVYIGGLSHVQESEEKDRGEFGLPYGQAELIRAVTAVNPRLIVVLQGGSAVEMSSWVNDVPSVLQAWYNGSEAGTALAEVLLGECNPSGKLPVTFAKKLEDYPAHAGGVQRYPGADGAILYEEGVFNGYRGFDSSGTEPIFPFGHGLSYSIFKYDHMQFVPWPRRSAGAVKITISNASSRDGMETIQIYVEPRHPSVPRPRRELKGFLKVRLKAGETQTISVPLDANAFSFFNVSKGEWESEPDDYLIEVGASSRDIRLDLLYRLKG